MSNRKKNTKYWIGRIHLWLGLTSGLVVLFLGLTGCILAFQREIEDASQPWRFVRKQEKVMLPPSRIQEIAAQALPGKAPHSVNYFRSNRAAEVVFYHDPEYYYIMHIDPYSGAVLKTRDMSSDFFRIMVNGHFYLWLPAQIGQPIVASATLIFVVMIITGMILWWPKNKAARKQRFSLKLNARWRRVNYDLHNVLGFYMTWVIIFIALTGLVWGFQWFAKTVYWTTSGGKTMTAYYEPHSAKNSLSAPGVSIPAVDRVWDRMNTEYPVTGSIEVHFPENDSSAIAAGANPDIATYWQADYRYFDQYTLAEIPVTHAYGRFANTSTADKIARMNYDIHVGAVLGLPGKIMAFFASLIAASLPVTGFYIWWGRRKKKKAETRPQQAKRIAEPA